MPDDEDFEKRPDIDAAVNEFREELEGELAKDGIEVTEWGFATGRVDMEPDNEMQAKYADIGAEILVLARAHGCTCHPTVYVYLMWGPDSNLHGARIEHEAACIGKMKQRAAEGNN